MQRWGRKPAPRTPGGAQPTVLSRDLPETSLRIVGEAGRGGAATVYRARDDVLGRDVALKVYHRLESDRDKLVREARMAVSLAMPGVVQIFDVDPEHGFIAMEWVERGSVADALETGVAGEMHPAGGWFADLGKTLARIHERGFVHADLKPANVLLLNPARAIVSDFGLALPLGSRHLGASEGYVSPERQAGARASAEDDVFALGCILERVLDAVGQLRSEDLRGWRELSVHLTGGDRPCDAGELLRLLPPR